MFFFFYYFLQNTLRIVKFNNNSKFNKIRILNKLLNGTKVNLKRKFWRLLTLFLYYYIPNLWYLLNSSKIFFFLSDSKHIFLNIRIWFNHISNICFWLCFDSKLKSNEVENSHETEWKTIPYGFCVSIVIVVNSPWLSMKLIYSFRLSRNAMLTSTCLPESTNCLFYWT